MTSPAVTSDSTTVAPSAERSRWAALYEGFRRVVHGIAVAHVGPVDADDVTQDVFVRAFHRLDQVRDQAALPRWICAVARSVAVDHLRRRRGRERAAADLDDAPASGGAAADDRLAERVLELVQTLPQAYRETLVLRLVEGLSGPEIADRTGLTHGSVRVNLNRGMNLLRPLLAREGWQ